MSSNIVDITPAEVAAWPSPNYIDPVLRTWMLPLSGVLFATATLMVVMRFYLRARGYAGRLGLDDGILLPAWLASVMFTGVSIVYVTWAEGNRHIWDVSAHKLERLAVCLWLAELSFLICGGLTKVSVLLFYRRLVKGTCSKLWEWLLRSAIAFIVAYTITLCITLVFMCTPTSAFWKAINPSYATNHHYVCLDTKIVNPLSGIFAAVTDLYTVALPCMMTWHFPIPKAQKIALNIIFCLGLIIVAASGVRTYYLVISSHGSDVSWKIYDLFAWAQVELQLGIMCASAPSLHVFLRHYLNSNCTPSTSIFAENDTTTHSVTRAESFESMESNAISANKDLRSYSTEEKPSEDLLLTGVVSA